MSINYPGLTNKGTKADSAHPNPSERIHSVVNKSDNDYLQVLDPETLEPIGVAKQKVLHPELTGPSSSTHAKYDPVSGNVYNYNLDFVDGSGKYRVFVAEAATGNVEVIATISAELAYLHSFFLTEHFVLLCIWNSTFIYGGASILWSPTWYVVDRNSKGHGLVAKYTSGPFYAFHTINAYEETNV